MEHQVARRVTIADVAEAAGVSKTAVSFAFNNPEKLGQATLERVLGVARNLGGDRNLRILIVGAFGAQIVARGLDRAAHMAE